MHTKTAHVRKHAMHAMPTCTIFCFHLQSLFPKKVVSLSIACDNSCVSIYFDGRCTNCCLLLSLRFIQ